MAYSKCFGNRKAVHPHLVQRGTGGVAGEVGDLRYDTENAFRTIETRTGMPSADWIDGGAVPYDGGDAVIKGTNLLQGQTVASRACGTGNALVTFYAMRPGEGGNSYAVVITQGAGSLTVTFAADLLTVELDSGGSTAAEVATEVNKAVPNDCKGVIRCVAGGTGLGTVLVAAEANLSGGTGEGWTCTVTGVDCAPMHATGSTPAATITETVCTVTVPDLSAETDARAAADIAALVITSDGVQSLPISFALGA